MPKKEFRCASCNKLLMKGAEIKCQRCKEIVVVGNPCEYFDDCPHRLKKNKLSSMKNLINTFPIAMKERLRLSTYTTINE